MFLQQKNVFLKDSKTSRINQLETPMPSKLRLLSESVSSPTLQAPSVQNGLTKKRRQRLLAQIKTAWDFSQKEGLLLGEEKEIQEELEKQGAKLNVLSPRSLKHPRRLFEFPFEDESQDFLFVFGVFANLSQKERRLALFECSRVLKKEGIAFFSIDLDLYSYNPEGYFILFLEREFEMIERDPHFDGLWIRLRTFLKTPLYFARGFEDPQWRKEKKEGLQGWKKLAFTMQTSSVLGKFWKGWKKFYRPVFEYLDVSKFPPAVFSFLGKRLAPRASLAHVTVTAKKSRRSLPA